MKKVILTISLLFAVLLLAREATRKAQIQPIVYIFLSEDCPISQYCTLALKELHKKYADDAVKFVGIFPNTGSTDEKITAFAKEYQLPFELMADKRQELAQKLGATITPQAIIVDQNEQILYRGRIDNAFASFGKRRRVVTERDLEKALDLILAGEHELGFETPAVGCYIERIQ